LKFVKPEPSKDSDLERTMKALPFEKNEKDKEMNSITTGTSRQK
jgi:hypothetical protein